MLALDDPAFLSRFHTGSPVQQIGDSPFFTVGSWDLIADVVRRPEDFSSNLTATMVCHDDGSVSEFPVAGLGDAMHVLATADGPRHRLHRSLVMPSLTPARIRALEPYVAEVVDTAWSEGVDDDTIDWTTAVAQRVPITVVTELLGLPHKDIDDLARWAGATNVLIDGVITPDQLTTATTAVAELTAYLDEALDSALRNEQAGAPGRGVLAEIASAAARNDLDHPAAVMILLQLVAAGSDSTVSLLTDAVRILAQHPEVAARLRREPDLIPVFVEETLRLESPFRGHFRHVVADTTVGDTHLPAGSHVYLMWRVANRDPEHFDAAPTVDLDRAAARSGHGSHLAFGKGLHLCVGAGLARLQGRLAVARLLDATTEFRQTTTGELTLVW
ncbi:cytochrome P450 [Gordonia rubripertincta]|uniref:Cytochrome P450 n=2 Tax=Gordonia rubripertincta TaxID=36822 RepID=A0AAW6RA18_GORRU|nr:cytochrome P450 [Gordonia rubripertincta]MDG6780139.1 cytochrome P450 [Gordonia rubripertincta]NKY63426.1 cytochrome P450 [Gordonia rubripertincta]GAB84487.1 putative cytochrome P450 [Gordonia rubripertincta NBRC 101908]